MKQKIIFLNGAINAGKSTVAKLLAKEMPNTALVEIDVLRDMVDWMPLDEAIPLNLENAVSILKNFVKAGLNVIIPYPLSHKNYEYMADALEGLNVQLHVFTLDPTLEKALKNRGTRELDTWEKDRIQHHYSIGIHNPDFGEIIDTSDQTAEETARYILTKIQ